MLFFLDDDQLAYVDPLKPPSKMGHIPFWGGGSLYQPFFLGGSVYQLELDERGTFTPVDMSTIEPPPPLPLPPVPLPLTR